MPVPFQVEDGGVPSYSSPPVLSPTAYLVFGNPAGAAVRAGRVSPGVAKAPRLPLPTRSERATAVAVKPPPPRTCPPGYAWVGSALVPVSTAAEQARRAAVYRAILASPAPARGGVPAALMRYPPRRGFPGFNTPVPSVGARRAHYTRRTIASFSGLSALDPTTESAVRGVIQRTEAAAKKLEEAKPGFFTSLFQTVIGAGSTIAAANEAVRQQRKLADMARTKGEAIITLGDDAAARKFLDDARNGRWDDVEQTVRTVAALTPGAALVDVGGATAKEAGELVTGVGTGAKGVVSLVKYAPWIAGGLLVIGVLSFARRTGERVGGAAAEVIRTVPHR